MLHRYVGTRVIALDKGEEHGMVAPELFKGKSFMNLDMGVPTGLEYRVEYPAGKVVVDDPKGITILDEEFQGEESFIHRLDEVREWLKVEPLEVHANECVISFRGGEYTLFPDLYLPFTYWHHAMENMKSVNPDVEFRIVTDDPESAARMIPNVPITHEIGHDWRSIRYAPYLILSNSSFGILPAHLNQNVKKIIAPLHWARHNLGFWALPQNCYSAFEYQDWNGKLTSGAEEKAKLE